jgi:nicotinamidase-related amidase
MPVSAGGMAEGWADLPPALEAQADLVITRRQWGAFYGTELDLQLRRRGVDTLVLAGITTNFGIESTARTAAEHDYAVVFAADAISGIALDLHDFAFANIFPRVGLIRTTEEIVAALRG